MSTSPVTPPPTSGTGSSSSTGIPSAQSLNNMFLQLLVAQLQNQDPTDPVDPSQFVGQLAQFSELSEVTSIYQLLQQAIPSTGSSGTGGTGGTGTGSSGGTSPAGGLASNGANSGILPGYPTPMPAAGSPSSTAPATISPRTLLPGPVSLPGFAAPSVSALTSKLQGGF
jgi:flagellar basal-body rod modification protein FlgD